MGGYGHGRWAVSATMININNQPPKKNVIVICHCSVQCEVHHKSVIVNVTTTEVTSKLTIVEGHLAQRPFSKWAMATKGYLAR